MGSHNFTNYPTVGTRYPFCFSTIDLYCIICMYLGKAESRARSDLQSFKKHVTKVTIGPLRPIGIPIGIPIGDSQQILFCVGLRIYLYVHVKLFIVHVVLTTIACVSSFLQQLIRQKTPSRAHCLFVPFRHKSACYRLWLNCRLVTFIHSSHI